jgi:hypothetical protein
MGHKNKPKIVSIFLDFVYFASILKLTINYNFLGETNLFTKVKLKLFNDRKKGVFSLPFWLSAIVSFSSPAHPTDSLF